MRPQDEYDPMNVGSPPDARWTIANTAEQMPGVLSPLTITMTSDEMDLGLLQGFAKLGVFGPADVRLPERRSEYVLGFFYGRCAVNVGALRRLFDLTPGTSGAAYEAQMFGGEGLGESHRLPRSRYPIVAVRMPLELLRTPRVLRGLRHEVQEWWSARIPTIGTMTLEQARAALIDAEAMALKVGPYVWVSTLAAQLAFGRIAGLAAAAGHPGLETTVCSGYGTEEIEMANDLWAVSRDRMSRDAFLARHGWTAPRGMELEEPSWRERPDLVDGLIDSYRRLPDTDDPRLALGRQAAGRAEAERRILAGLPLRRRVEARVLFRIAKEYMQLRTIQKASHVIPWDVQRAAARRIGDLLIERGVLADSADVFHLTKDELLAEPVPGDLQQRASARAARRAEYQGYTVPDWWTGVPEPIVIADQATPETDGRLQGAGVSPGIVEGPVRVVHSPTDAEVQPGEILVCETTDPSWIGLMVVAAGMIIDVGGAVSHGAIVARELGVPCVIGTKIGTTVLRTGQHVRVDGTTGEVEILAEVV